MKKSMSFPTVKGTLIDIVEDRVKRLTAMISGFLSGLASATILLKDEALLPALDAKEGSHRASTEGFAGADCAVNV